MVPLLKQIKLHKNTILTGSVLAIDPASRSLGYAIAEAGEVVEYGSLVAEDAPINIRLQSIVNVLQEEEYDILVIELIRGSMAHVYLHWAVGAIVSAVQAPILLELPIHAWKAWVGKEYIKGDDTDANAIAETLLALARESED